jgi:predicted dienelactone hydrolase
MNRVSVCWGLGVLLAMAVVGPQGVEAGEGAAGNGEYAPLKVREGWTPQTVLLDVRDEQRSRTLPIKVYLPETKQPAAVVLFSHGLGGSRNNNPYLGNHWSARGYVVVFVQHPGSDESVWRDAQPRRRMDAMREAANLENTLLRLKDVPAVLDQLERWQEEGELKGRMNLKAVGMSGHSFGAVTTQGVSGQTARRGGAGFTEKRIRAALPMSPSAPMVGDAATAFGQVSIPWLLMTGTKDVAAVGGATLESRLAVYPALPAGSKYELVLKDAEHLAFGERALRGSDGKRNPNHHRAILAISTAFWDAYLKEDAAARAWLDGDGPRSVLEKEDTWQRK